MFQTRLIFSSTPRRGFTLVELLVVIGIIAVLAGLALPLIVRSYRSAERTRIAGDLQAIATALQAYHDDHGMYPAVTGPQTGSQVLCWALIAPRNADIDNHDGPGFRLRAQGRVYGPYLAPDRFAMSQEDFPRLLIRDQPILYFPANTTRPNLNQPHGYVAAEAPSPAPSVGTFGLYDQRHSPQLPADLMRRLMGADPDDGSLPTSEEPAYTGPFILWTAGNDGAFGTRNDVANFDLRTDRLN